ncbi:Protein SWAP [Trichinella nativa]|uniref:Protein SWAP n=1 Tax=Trichinella nativa TaxID=6335 RepID=A0A0V1LQY8_9BILA|nr:Protein SWAP [Trichinella nativa]
MIAIISKFINKLQLSNLLREESSDEFLAFGYPCKLFDSRGGRDCADESADLIPLHCNRKILVDRIMSLFGYQMDFIKEFDCRLQLSNLEKYDASKVEQSLLIADRSLEALLDAERYRDFKLTCETPKVENEKRMGTEIYFNYDDLESKPQHGCQPKEEAEGTEDEQQEQFVPPAELKVPVGVTLPKTVKEGIIIEKTAAFIAEQGSQMEIIVNAKQKSNPQFRFLDWNHPLNKYYKHVLKMIKEKRYTPVVVKKDPAPESESDSDDSGEHYLHPSLMGGAGKTAVAKDTEPLSLPKTSYRLGEENDVYSELFNGLVAVCPQLAAAVSTAKGKETGGSAEGLLLPPPPDLYPVVDRVAAYVARNGPQFEQILRERNDPRFSFIDPSNKYNPYYMALLQNYESENYIVRLQQNVQNQFVEGVPMSLNYLSYYGFVPQPPPPPRSTPPPPAVENQEETLNLKKTKTVYCSDHLTSAAASSSVSEKPTEMGSVGPVCFTIKAKNQEETCSMMDKANLDAHQDETINLSLQSDSDVLMSDCAEKFDCKFVDGSGDAAESTVKSVDEYMQREITTFPEVGKKEQKNVEEDLNLKRARRYRAKKFVDEFAKKIRKREKSCVDEEKVKKHGHISEGELCDSESSEIIELLCSRCDADPAALAKYVMALLKKDKTEADLKHFCLDQLDVFLQKETKKFVDELFLALKSKVYIVTDKESQSTSTKEVPKKRSLEPSRNEKPSADEHLKSRRVDSHSGSRPVRRYGSSPKARSKSSERSKGKGDATSISQNKASSSTVRDRVKTHWSPSNNKEQRKSTHKEKGYCMLGDNCVYDHGPDPVVVEDVALSSMIPSRSNKSLPTPPPNFSVPPPGYVPIPPPPPGVDSNFQTEGYNPEAPSLTSASTGTAVPLPPPYTQPPPPIWAQLPPVLRPFGPRQIASYAQLRVCYEGDPQAALITYMTRPQALAAYKSTDPILNNRFIRVFWHNQKDGTAVDDSGTPDQSSRPARIPIRDRLELPVKSSSNGTSSHEEAIFKAETNATSANTGSDTISTTMNKMDGDAFATKSVRLVHNADAEVKSPMANVAASKGENTKVWIVVWSNNKHCRNSAYRPERNRRIPRSAVLDLRSRSILITDFRMEHKDALIEHLQQFGTLRDIDFYPLTDPAVGKVIASFYDRKEAERAFTDGKLFKDQLLNMTWAVEDKDAMAAALSSGSKSDLSAKALLKTLDPPDDDDDDDDLFEENEEVEEEEQQLT